jgi:hypothetical protein
MARKIDLIDKEIQALSSELKSLCSTLAFPLGMQLMRVTVSDEQTRTHIETIMSAVSENKTETFIIKYSMPAPEFVTKRANLKILLRLMVIKPEDPNQARAMILDTSDNGNIPWNEIWMFESMLPGSERNPQGKIPAFKVALTDAGQHGNQIRVTISPLAN